MQQFEGEEPREIQFLSQRSPQEDRDGYVTIHRYATIRFRSVGRSRFQC